MNDVKPALECGGRLCFGLLSSALCPNCTILYIINTFAHPLGMHVHSSIRLLVLFGVLVVMGLSRALGQAAPLLVAEQVAGNPGAVQFPYNPDVDASGTIATEDLIGFLLYFGDEDGFDVATEAEGLDSLSLPEVLESLASLLVAQQNQIEALEGQLNAYQLALDTFVPLINLLPVALNSSFAENTWTMSGLNVQLVNGSGSTYGTSNGLGNLVLGYNEEDGGHRDSTGTLVDGEVRMGSHNMVLGGGHSYAGNGGLIGGFNNTAWGQGAGILGGRANFASGAWSSVLGGLDNAATGLNSTISGGHSNTASGDRSSVSGGLLNLSGGIATSVLGGQYMQVFEQYETASGQFNIND